MQIDALHDAGVLDDEMFHEFVSGAAVKRPQLDLAIKALQAGDVFIVWKLDRLARNVEELLKRVRQIEDAGARFIVLTQSIDTGTAVGRLLMHLLGAVAEFERELTRERTKRGMQAKAERGIHVGRPAMFTEERAKTLAGYLNKGLTVAKAAAKMKLSRSGIYLNYEIEKKRGKYVVARKRK